ncbi:DUF5999 family protein [Streptomyces noursei]|uniref:DUF5999 family protein n=1 Tax=Streptomyces noursei TaxID=1971 RepID=UPI003EBE3BA9
MCQHQPPCPPPEASDRESAHLIANRPEQGWRVNRTNRLSGAVVAHRRGVGA